ncbi:hypothetical protein KIPB_008006 [Kipferlia bialata]|nr:hypothetical protein KIPB_008006 [Kipferlia bialata]|eukprot:g8006.t1
MIDNIAEMAAGMSYLEFSQRVGSLVSGRASVNRVPVGDLPLSLWVTSTGGVRQYASGYELLTAITLETGRSWTDSFASVSCTMREIGVSCYLVFTEGDEYPRVPTRLSLLPRVRCSTICHHSEQQQVPIGRIGLDRQVMPVRVPFIGDMIEGPLSCQFGVNQVVGFTCRGKWVPREARKPSFALGHYHSVGQRTGCRIITHTDQGLKCEEVECPEILTYLYPKGMCVMGGMLYVFGSFPDTTLGDDALNAPLINRLFALHLDTREWMEVEGVDGFPSDPVSIETRRCIDGFVDAEVGVFAGTVEVFSLDGALYVLLHTSLAEGTDTPPLTTLHRYYPEAPEGTPPWTQLMVGHSLRPSCVATHNGSAHVLAEDALSGSGDSSPLHLTFRPTVDTGTTIRLLDETDNGWEGGLAAPESLCDNAFVVDRRLYATTKRGELLAYNATEDRWKEHDEQFHTFCRLCPLGLDTLLEHPEHRHSDHTAVIHLAESVMI